MSLALNELLVKYKPDKYYKFTRSHIKEQCTILMYIILKINKLINPNDVHQFLLKNPDEINKKNVNGWTPLTVACFNYADYPHYVNIIETLLKMGSNPNLQLVNDFGSSLHIILGYTIGSSAIKIINKVWH